jgi:hypothetical protein
LKLSRKGSWGAWSMTVPWQGSVPIAIVPVWDDRVDPQPSSNFREQVTARVFYDPQGSDDSDDSLQNYVWTVSYGQASISGAVFPVVRSSGSDVTGAAMDSLPAGHGYTHLLAVLPHGSGPDRSSWAWWDQPARNGVTSFARVSLFQNSSLTMRQPTGTWAMETLHMVTEFGDLYNVSPNLGRYDVMANAFASSHPSAHTKSAMGWISPSGIVRHVTGTRSYVLHAVGLRQPPPPGRVSAVRIPARSGTRSFIAEARLAVDKYERSDALGDGIPAEGVIVYEIASLLDVRLRSVLVAGQRYTNEDEGFSVTASGTAVPGGWRISVTRAEDPRCEELRRQIAALEEDLETETDPDVRRALLQALGRARRNAQALGCRVT